MDQMRWIAVCLASFLAGTVSAQSVSNPASPYPAAPPVISTPRVNSVPAEPQRPGQMVPTTEVTLPAVVPLQTGGKPGQPAEPGVAKDEGGPVPRELAQGIGQEQMVMEACQPETCALGPTPVEDVRILQNLIFGERASRFKIYGWLETEYDFRTTGRGPTNVAPLMDRFGDEFMLRELAFRIERQLDPRELSWGFTIQPYAGSDAAFLNPIRGAMIQNPNPRFGFDLGELNVTAHLPVLTEGGVDIKAGRQSTVIGSQGSMAPWRIFASSDYQWAFAEDHFFTGISANWHVTQLLDIYNGIEWGWNTFYTELTEQPTYIGQINYWLTDERKTCLTSTVLTGPERTNSSRNTTVVELRVVENWYQYLTQIVQSHLGFSGANTFGPFLGHENFYGVWNIFQFHVTPKLDTNFRTEWYDDVEGHGFPGGTGFRNNYVELTFGLDYHPTPWLQIRPEIRSDFADHTPAFGATDNIHLHRDQLTVALEVLVKF
jgi:hypothetical protein